MASPQIQANEQPDISQTLKILERFKEIDPTIQVMTAAVLLYVAQNQGREGGLTTGDIASGVGLTAAAASRNSYYWAQGVSDMPKGGHEFLDIGIDRRDRRRRVIQLTAQGEKLFDPVWHYLYNQPVDIVGEATEEDPDCLRIQATYE